MKNQIEIVKEIADGMEGIGGIPNNEEFYAEFDIRVREALGIERKKKPWNLGKRKPEPDQDGDLWCSCVNPRLVSNHGGRGQAYCLLCGTPYYH